MKHFGLMIAACLIVFTGCAKPPTDGYKKFYREYRDAPNTITFKIPGGLAGFLIDDDDLEAKEFIKNVDDISFFISDDITKEMLIDFNRYLPEELYKEMMVIRDGGDEVVFLAKDVDGIIEEILMTVVSDNEIVVMALLGEFTKEDAKRVIKAIKTDDAINFRM